MEDKWPEASRPADNPLDSFQPGVPAPSSPMAVVSLATGILSYFALPIIGAVVAVISGVSARREIRRSGGAVGGWTMATAGLWLGVVHLALVALAMFVVIAMILAGVGFLWFNR
jgi:Domain of unknown function (DUF4190)